MRRDDVEIVLNPGEDLNLHLDIVVHCKHKLIFSDVNLKKIIEDYLKSLSEE